MKKITKLLCVFGILGMLVSVPAHAGNTDTVGGWQISEDAAVSNEAEEALNKALEKHVGTALEPVAELGSQVVAGVNYCLLCRVTNVTPGAESHYAIVYVYAGVNGTCEILEINDLEIEIGLSNAQEADS